MRFGELQTFVYQQGLEVFFPALLAVKTRGRNQRLFFDEARSLLQ